jgi:tRNA pseudouridine55 synthase
LLLINKPKGISSFDVIRRLRSITAKTKIGHAGTLDPLASGLMLMLLGDTTKQAAAFSGLDKTYIATVALGGVSSTGDSEGLLSDGSDRRPSLEELERVLATFVGTITQTPPVYSAIKIAGREAYKRARAGETFEMPKRHVTVYKIRLLDYKYPEVKIETEVSSGTYIRTLAEDIGAALGTGAYIAELTRTAVGDFLLSQSLDLNQADKLKIESHLLRLASNN